MRQEQHIHKGAIEVIHPPVKVDYTGQIAVGLIVAVVGALIVGLIAKKLK